MAFVDFQNPDRAQPLPRADRSNASGSDDRLTALEWVVVAVARKDGRGSLQKPGRVTSLLRALLKRPNPRLSDQRLEALRRMAVLLRHNGEAVAPREVDAFLAAGFTAGQHRTLAAAIAAAAKNVGPTRPLRSKSLASMLAATI